MLSPRNQQYRRENLYKVIVIYIDDAGITRGAKYRNIECDKLQAWERSKKYFKQKYPTATHVNVYGGVSGVFKGQQKL
jgi:hypothetical protein